MLHAIDKKPAHPRESEEHLATYAAARALLALAGDNYAARKWAQGEAAAFAEELAREPPEVVRQVARELLPSLEETGGAYRVSVLDYARHGRDLAHQAVEKGRVFLDGQQALHLLGRAIESRLLAAASHQALREAPEELKRAAQELRARLPKYEVPIEVAGKDGAALRQAYLARPCVQEIRKGAAEGKRYYACMALAIALRHDNVPVEQAREVITEFANNCGKGARPFTPREALTTLDWAYKRDRPARLSCKSLISQGVIPDHCATCPYKPGRRAKGEAA